MRSRQGARCRCNGTDFVPDHVRRTLTRFGEGYRTEKLLRCQADKSSWTMVPYPRSLADITAREACPFYSQSGHWTLFIYSSPSSGSNFAVEGRRGKGPRQVGSTHK